MKEKEKDLPPPSIEEVEKVFFGEDDSKPINFGVGRLKKDKKEFEKELPTDLLNSFPKSDDEKESDDNTIEDEDIDDEEMTPTIEVNKTEKEDKKPLGNKKINSIRNQLDFLKRYEDRQEKLSLLQKQYDLEKSVKEEIRKKLKDEKEKKDEFKFRKPSYLVKFKNPIGALYGKGGKIYVTECNHIDTYDTVQGIRILTRCTKCSRIKEWDPKEWDFFQANKYKKNCN
jgi:hypothetical protein